MANTSTNRLLVLVPHQYTSWRHENLGKALHAADERLKICPAAEDPQNVSN